MGNKIQSRKLASSTNEGGCLA